jgi:uncharacterized protein YdaU (DUF1376 family)
MTIWRAPDCRIPNDDEWLSRRFRRTVEAVNSELRPIINEFCQTTGNWISQKRLKQEWDYCQERSKKQSDKAKSRWDKEKDVCSGNTNTPPSGNAPNPNPNPNPIEYKKTVSRAVAKATRTEHPEFQNFWMAYPRRKGANPRWPASLKFSALVAAGADPQSITDAARRYSDEQRTAGKENTEFIAQAQVWLNQRRHEDYAASETTETPDNAGWRPGMPTSDELRAKYARERAERERGTVGTEGRMATDSPVDENSLRPRESDEGLVCGSDGLGRIFGLGSVFREKGMGSFGVQADARGRGGGGMDGASAMAGVDGGYAKNC